MVVVSDFARASGKRAEDASLGERVVRRDVTVSGPDIIRSR